MLFRVWKFQLCFCYAPFLEKWPGSKVPLLLWQNKIGVQYGVTLRQSLPMACWRRTIPNKPWLLSWMFICIWQKTSFINKNSKTYLTFFEGCVARLYKNCLIWSSQQSQEGEIILPHTWLVSKLSPEVGWLSQVLWQLWERAVQAPEQCRPQVCANPESELLVLTLPSLWLQSFFTNSKGLWAMTHEETSKTPFSTKNNCHKISCLLNSCHKISCLRNSVKGELCGRGS